MANVYVEARPKGRRERSGSTNYMVEDHANHALGAFKIQQEAVGEEDRSCASRGTHSASKQQTETGSSAGGLDLAVRKVRPTEAQGHGT
jgi:hypothetical protein